MKLRITIDGKVYEVEVDVSEPEPPHPGYVPPAAQTRVPTAKPVAAPPVQPSAAPVADETKVCRSPIAGVVVRVSAQVERGKTTGIGSVGSFAARVRRSRANSKSSVVFPEPGAPKTRSA